jgi:DNA-binding CsgD family transcriptional regulator
MAAVPDLVMGVALEQLNGAILAIHRAAAAAADEDYQAQALGAARPLVALHSTSWVHGVMVQGVPRFDGVHTTGMAEGYWARFLSLAALDPLGPRMFAAPGQSFATGEDDFPAAMVEGWLRPYDVRWAVSGMQCDPATGVFSVVCWHRSAGMPAFTEAERRLHALLLPHWMAGLNQHRVGAALQALHRPQLDGTRLALCEPGGRVRFAQPGFGELVASEFGGALQGELPAALQALCAAPGGSRRPGRVTEAQVDPAPMGLRLLQLRPLSALDRLTPREREVAGWLARGQSLKQAAQQLGISPSTADKLRAGAYTKLAVRNRAQLAQVAGLAPGG